MEYLKYLTYNDIEVWPKCTNTFLDFSKVSRFNDILHII